MSDQVKEFARIQCTDVRRLLPFLDFGDHRSYCSVIRIEPTSNGCVLVATNGHYMATMHALSMAQEPFSLQLSKRFAREIKAITDTSDIVLEKKDALSKIVDPSGVVTYINPGEAIQPAEYAKWRAVIPSDDELVPGIVDAFSVKYLCRALRFVRSEGGTWGENSVRFFHKPGGPTLVRKRSMSVLIMPMHEQDFSGAGEWLK